MTTEKKDPPRRLLRLLDELYNMTDQAVFHILEKFDEHAKLFTEELDEENISLFHNRYEWLSCYLRHYRLGDDCLHITKNVYVEIDKDPYLE